MRIPFISLLLQGIPESMSVAILAFSIARIPLRLNKALFIGTVLAFCAYIVRLLPIPFGSHTILMFFLLFLVLLKSSKGNVGLAFMASLLSEFALVIYESLCLSLFMCVFDFTPETLYHDVVMMIVSGELHVFLLLFSAFLLNRFVHYKGLHKIFFTGKGVTKRTIGIH